MALSDLYYRVLGVNVAVRCSDPDLRLLIQADWGQMASEDVPGDLNYTVSRIAETAQFGLASFGQPAKSVADEGQLLHELQTDAIISIQQHRQDLYFIHAAVAELDGAACIFVAESGAGKSTTLWGLLHHGWRYLSDELAPIQIASLQVHAYPRALCLKSRPPERYPLPHAAVQTPHTFHVPVAKMPCDCRLDPTPLAAAYFVEYCSEASVPEIQPIGAAEAAARLYADALNPLAHANAGLLGAVEISKRIPCYTLDTADLSATCELVTSHARRLRKSPIAPRS